MIDVKQYFHKNLIAREIREGVTTPIAFVKKSSNNDFNNPDFPEALNKLYSQVDLIKIIWQIIQDEESGEMIINELKKDPWLKENYWYDEEDQEELSNNGLGIVHEYLSGFINIQKVEDMLNPDYYQREGYYYTIKNKIEGEDPENYVPFDITWSLTAVLKRENGKIIDNVWLVYTDGESMYDMKITIEKYLELCYKSKGFHYWQLGYVLREETDYWELMKRYLPMLFPDVELELSDFGMEK